MGRHSQHSRGPDPEPPDAPLTEGDWEELPPPAPLWRSRIVTSAVLLLAVVAGTWWAVSWLTSPAGPGGAGTPAAAPVHQPADADPVQDSGQRPTGGGDEISATASGAASSESDHDAGPSDQNGSVTVHVAGEVREPGLVELPTGSRVADALQAAGGPTNEAHLDLLNLAAPAVDASQILVPGPDTPVGGQAGTQPAVQPGGRPGTDDRQGTGTINLNTADAASLEQLPGIGPALAGRIVEHRDQVGPFGSMEDLDAVSGIGPAMMERLDGLVSW